jgi:branched-chain amino acid aminotransferase
MAKGESGQYTAKIKGWMGDIMYGNEQHPWGVVVNEKQ